MRLKAVLMRLGCRYLDSQFCAPLHALRGSVDVMLRARAHRKSRKSGAGPRLLPCRHVSPRLLLLLTMATALHVGLLRARDHRNCRGSLC